MRAALAWVCGGSLGCGLWVAACGGATSGEISDGDSGADGTANEGGSHGSSSGGADATQGGEASSPAEAGAHDGGSPPCPPPSDPSKASLCLTVVPEDIAFTSDSRFDGKGWLVAQVFDSPLPDYPDGGSKPALATKLLPAGAPDAGTLDLSQGVPRIDLDGLPEKVYARAIFVDSPAPTSSVAAGTWIAGYDLTGGIQSALPLQAQTLTKGSGTSITLSLIALRELIVTMNRTATAAGNAEGPATFVATPDQAPTSASLLFGVGQSACARVDGTNQAQVSGFVLGKGPYYVTGIVDDFGLADGGVSLPPGALVSLEPAPGGGYRIPAANQIAYPANAYRVSQTISLGLVLPGAPANDTVSCP